MITEEQYQIAKDILWDDAINHLTTTSQEISEKLGEALKSVGVNVKRVGRKPRSRNKFILFEITVKRVSGMETKFLTLEEARNWHNAKNRNLNTLMKAPKEAFEDVKVEDSDEMIWWNQAFSLAYRLGADLEQITERIMKTQASKAAIRFGV